MGFFGLFCKRGLVQTQQQNFVGIWVIFNVISDSTNFHISHQSILFYTFWPLKFSNTCVKYSGSKDYLCGISGLFWGGRRPRDVRGGRWAVLSGGYGRGKHFRRHRLVLLPRRLLCGAFSGALYTSHTTNCSKHTDKQRHTER